MQESKYFLFLKEISLRPEPFQFYSAPELWNDDYISKQLLGLHLDPNVDMVSRNPRFIDRSVSWLKDRFNISPKSSILDLGGGPGLYANRLARFGASVTSIDVSQRSIAYAEKIASSEKLSVEYVCSNYLEYSFSKKYDLILMIFCEFCSLSSKQQKNIFHKINNLLTENGCLVLDVYSFNQFNIREAYSGYEHVTKDGFWAEGEYFGFLHTFKYEGIKLILDKYTLVQKNSIRTFYNWLQYYSRESLNLVFEKNDLKIEAYFADATGAPYREDSLEIAVVARKK